jgi:hypothetical protein
MEKSQVHTIIIVPSKRTPIPLRATTTGTFGRTQEQYQLIVCRNSFLNK